MVGRHLRITGRVQGVGYRYWFLGRAESLGLTGWVRNRADGSVEAVVQGPEDKAVRIIAEAESGPPAARVGRVETTELPTDTTLIQFEQRPTC
ncbi:acylphosphatase [Sphingomonas sp. CFBP8993]|uniref:acylphosphatase n=1 Tax=Sphingomonas sp. CFBP8993 TaxID=3096526 RepID=UPI002A69C9ED|nr:acylphosphatase [Sphingomonas sp. CFBP8993]MDY0959232.1 acylphosphatase [Sphingomonas sp. CFBP8993]